MILITLDKRTCNNEITDNECACLPPSLWCYSLPTPRTHRRMARLSWPG